MSVREEDFIDARVLKLAMDEADGETVDVTGVAPAEMEKARAIIKEADREKADCCGDATCCPYDHPHTGDSLHPHESTT